MHAHLYVCMCACLCVCVCVCIICMYLCVCIYIIYIYIYVIYMYYRTCVCVCVCVSTPLFAHALASNERRRRRRQCPCFSMCQKIMCQKRPITYVSKEIDYSLRGGGAWLYSESTHKCAHNCLPTQRIRTQHHGRRSPCLHARLNTHTTVTHGRGLPCFRMCQKRPITYVSKETYCVCVKRDLLSFMAEGFHAYNEFLQGLSMINQEEFVQVIGLFWHCNKSLLTLW